MRFLLHWNPMRPVAMLRWSISTTDSLNDVDFIIASIISWMKWYLMGLMWKLSFILYTHFLSHSAWRLVVSKRFFGHLSWDYVCFCCPLANFLFAPPSRSIVKTANKSDNSESKVSRLSSTSRIIRKWWCHFNDFSFSLFSFHSLFSAVFWQSLAVHS